MSAATMSAEALGRELWLAYVHSFGPNLEHWQGAMGRRAQELLAAPGLVVRKTRDVVGEWERVPDEGTQVHVLIKDGRVYVWQSAFFSRDDRASWIGWCYDHEFLNAMQASATGEPVTIPWVRRVTRREWAPWEGEHEHEWALVVIDGEAEEQHLFAALSAAQLNAADAIAYLPLPAESLSAEAIRRAAGVQG